MIPIPTIIPVELIKQDLRILKKLELEFEESCNCVGIANANEDKKEITMKLDSLVSSKLNYERIIKIAYLGSLLIEMFHTTSFHIILHLQQI